MPPYPQCGEPYNRFAHKDLHRAGEADAFVLADILDCLARLEIKKAGASQGKRRAINFIEGANVTITTVDDAGNEEVDVTIASSGGSGAPTDATYLVTAAHIGLSNEIVVASYPFGTADHADDSITWAKIQNMAASRILGRITAGAGNIEELTGTQLTTMLDLFTSTLKGLVPASGGGTTNFLRADGTWAAPGGGTARESLVAQWSQSITKTNIGTAFVNIYNQTNADGKSVSIDTNGKTEVRLSVNWNKIGAGTQTVQVIDVVGSVVLISMNVVSGYNETALTAIPASLLNTVKRYNLRAKSTTSTDDPIFEGAAIYLK